MGMEMNEIVIAGMGRSGLAAAELALRKGMRPCLSDSRPAAALETGVAFAEKCDVPYECGGHSEEMFRNADVIVLSPGVPPEQPLLKACREQGVPVISELEFAWQFCNTAVLAVTGTNGKTTTTELLRAMIAACGHRTGLAGNNAVPFSRAVLEEPVPAYLVLEVSSYALERAFTFRPQVAAALNLSEDHLGRHRTMEEYARVKSRIFARMRAGGSAVLNADDPYTREMPVPDDVAILTFSRRGQYADVIAGEEFIRVKGDAVLPVSEIPLPGAHNLENALAAIAMIHAGGFEMDRALGGLRAFRGVEHRIEYVGDFKGAAWYNDSKATNIGSLRVALESFGQPVVLIAGGEGKGADYRVLRDTIAAHARHLITLGRDAPLLEDAFGDLLPLDRAQDMAGAVALAAGCVEKGDIALLSPGCASFDMYPDFEARGRDFKACVMALGCADAGKADA
jgi:UDP-N-acetylmuramoylalanine--D-glutamate ligase